MFNSTHYFVIICEMYQWLVKMYTDIHFPWSVVPPQWRCWVSVCRLSGLRWFRGPVALRCVCEAGSSAERRQLSHLLHRPVHRAVRLHRSRGCRVDLGGHRWTLPVRRTGRHGTWPSTSVSVCSETTAVFAVESLTWTFSSSQILLKPFFSRFSRSASLAGSCGQWKTVAGFCPAESGTFKRLGHFTAFVLLWRPNRALNMKHSV